MSSLVAHVFPGPLDTLKPLGGKNRSISHSQLSSRRVISNLDFNNEISIQRQNIVFIVLDLDSQFNSNATVALRAINSDVYVLTDLSRCHRFIQSCEEKIFFICTSTEKSIIEEFHQLKSVEAIFILNDTDAQLDGRFPKLFNIYAEYKELLLDLKETLDWYEQTQMEIFVFEHEQSFLWLQLWKDEFLKIHKFKGSKHKTKLVQVAENYYRGNTKMCFSINNFDQNYAKQDVLQWCFSSPFPSRFLHHALASYDTEQLSSCEFLLADLSQKIQSTTSKSNCELYKGMKMTKEYLDKFEDHVDKLICSKGFLQCVQSRKQALNKANSPDHRSDLIPVLFKISYDRTVSLLDLINKNNQSYVISNVYTVFRVKYVNRGPMTTIKIEVADEDGKNIARDYRAKHQTNDVPSLLNQLASPRKPSLKLPPIKSTKISVSVLLPIPSNEIIFSEKPIENKEVQAEECLQRGEITQAIALYQEVKPMTSRIYEIIGLIYTKKLGNYRLSIEYFEKALQLKEKNGENVIPLLSELGVAHQRTHEYQSALQYYFQAFEKCQQMPMKDPSSLASCLFGMANAYWGEKNYPQALEHAQQALALNESIERGNEKYISANLAILANIYYASGDIQKAIEMNERSLALAERDTSTDELVLATMRNNIATMQVSIGLFANARENYRKSLKIYRKYLPETHPQRISSELNFQRLDQIEKNQRNL